MAAAGASQVTIAQKTWEMSNNIMEVKNFVGDSIDLECDLLFEGERWR